MSGQLPTTMKECVAPFFLSQPYVRLRWTVAVITSLCLYNIIVHVQLTTADYKLAFIKFSGK